MTGQLIPFTFSTWCLFLYHVALYRVKKTLNGLTEYG